MNDGDKVTTITSDNYRDVCGRAEEIRAVLKEALSKDPPESPSLRVLQQRFGVSLKALFRHRRKVLDELGMEACPRPTSTVPRKRRGPADATPATEVEETHGVEDRTPAATVTTPESTPEAEGPEKL